MEAIMITEAIEAKQGSDIVTEDIPNAFFQSNFYRTR